VNAALLTFFFALLAIAPASAATPKKGADPRDREFVQACMLAFDQSSGNGSVGVGRQICECTVEESKHQGATRASVQKETAKIKADPKYKISDPKLLAAFQYCTIELMRQE
jgi:hypothetical protein